MPLPKYLAQANRLLAALPAPAKARFIERCELVDLAVGNVLTEVGSPVEHAFFPLDSFVAVVVKPDQTYEVQIDLIGNEGMVNASVVLGMHADNLKSVVQSSGRAYKIDRSALQGLLTTEPGLLDVFNRYLEIRLDQMARNIACAISHTVPQRLARWLLMAKDSTYSNELSLTHDVLAVMLGVRRESVSRAASFLRKHGLISYSRGDVLLLDEDGLQAYACPCYRTNLALYARVMGADPPD